MHFHGHVLRQAGTVPVSAMAARSQNHHTSTHKLHSTAAVQQAQEVHESALLKHRLCLSRQRPHVVPACLQAPTAAAGSHGYEEQRAETYLGETFWKSIPPSPDAGLWLDDAAATAAPAMQLVSLNHAALGVQDVAAMIKCEFSSIPLP